MPRNDGRATNREFTLHDVKICTANAAGGNTHKYFIVTGDRRCDFHQFERPAVHGCRPVKQTRSHDFILRQVFGLPSIEQKRGG
jgi:hypothetical protein